MKTLLLRCITAALRRHPIRAGGALIGALGVSGAPGGDKDERCALAALDKLQERLEFAE